MNTQATEADLRRLYWGEGLTLEKIGEEYDVTGATVLNWMEEHGIKRRTAAPQPTPPEERFNSQWTEDENECWIWQGPTPRYGRFYDGDNNVTAHRYSYRLHKGEIPDGVHVCHDCDVKVCVNPHHLYLGDVRQNVTDAIVRGEKDGKLTYEDAEEIRERYENGDIYQRELAEEYNVGQDHISRIVNREQWAGAPKKYDADPGVDDDD